MYYISREGQGYRETVGETDTKEDALYLLGEYRLGDQTGHYWMSSRSCKGWEETARDDVGRKGA